MAGHFRTVPAAASKAFPGVPQFSGFMKPNRFEGEVNNLEIIGEIPPKIDGTFYRVMPDPQFPPFCRKRSCEPPQYLSLQNSMLIA
jgi:hypothetical protein